jgi:hypothetical protein
MLIGAIRIVMRLLRRNKNQAPKPGQQPPDHELRVDSTEHNSLATMKSMVARRFVTGTALASSAVICAGAMAGPVGAAVHGRSGAHSHTTSAAASLIPTSTSWLTPRIGMTLAYPALKAGAKASLLRTQDGGRSWHPLAAPPVPFPVDQDQPQLVVGDGVIAVTNGTQIQAGQDTRARWSIVHLFGITSGSRLFISDLSIAKGRMLALVTQAKGSNSTARVYSGSASGTSMAPVDGLTETGSEVYGDISVQGSLQVVLGGDYKNEHYWYARSGSKFTAAPLPCPASWAPLLGGVRQGKPIALCSEPPSQMGPGSTLARVYTAPCLGGYFEASTKARQVPNPLGFAAASDSTMTLAAAPGLGGTFNAGGSWTSVVKAPEGSSWSGLAFPSPAVGVATGITLDRSGHLVGYVYRTTDAGRHWRALALP